MCILILQTMSFSFSVSSQCISALHFLAFLKIWAGLFSHGVLWSIISDRGINLTVSIHSSSHQFIPPFLLVAITLEVLYSPFLSSFRPYSFPVGSCDLSSHTYKYGHKQHREHTERQMGRSRLCSPERKSSLDSMGHWLSNWVLLEIKKNILYIYI